MAEFDIAFDNLDTTLGSYFEQSKTSIVAFIQAHNNEHLVHEISSTNCTSTYINPYFEAKGDRKFVFIAYSHGNDNCLVAENNWYINSPENIHHFSNSFFYSMACNTGKVMGLELINKGCLGFVGYSSTAYAALGDYSALFIDCDNYALKKFMEGSDLKSSFIEMKSFMRKSIKDLVTKRKGLLAGYLRSNLGCLVIHGNENLYFTDLINSDE